MASALAEQNNSRFWVMTARSSYVYELQCTSLHRILRLTYYEGFSFTKLECKGLQKRKIICYSNKKITLKAKYQEITWAVSHLRILGMGFHDSDSLYLLGPATD